MNGSGEPDSVGHTMQAQDSVCTLPGAAAARCLCLGPQLLRRQLRAWLRAAALLPTHRPLPAALLAVWRRRPSRPSPAPAPADEKGVQSHHRAQTAVRFLRQN